MKKEDSIRLKKHFHNTVTEKKIKEASGQLFITNNLFKGVICNLVDEETSLLIEMKLFRIECYLRQIVVCSMTEENNKENSYEFIAKKLLEDVNGIIDYHRNFMKQIPNKVKI